MPPGRRTRRSSRRPSSRSARLRTPKPTVAASKRAVRERQREQVALHPLDRRRLARARARASRSEKSSAGHRGRAGAQVGEREVAGAARGVEHAVAGTNDRARGEPAPAQVEPGRHHAVHRVVDRRDPVEHRAHGFGRERHCAPPRAERVLDADLVEHPRDDEVDERLDARGAVVEARRERQDRRAGAAQRDHALERDQRERRLARAEDELALLLERDRRGAVDQVLAARRRRACRACPSSTGRSRRRRPSPSRGVGARQSFGS